MCVRTLPSHLLDEYTYDASVTFQDVFRELLNTRALGNNDYTNRTGDTEQHISYTLNTALAQHNADLLALERANRYSRHVIGVQDNWVGYICRWEANVSSSIHGHPEFAYYRVISGEFTMDIYEIDGVASNSCATYEQPSNHKDQLTHTQTLVMSPGEHVWRWGSKGQYDNLIHKVSTGESPGFSLHLFSENPATGQQF